MAVFPSINPVYSAPKNSELKRQSILLGDGYESSLLFGLNPVQTKWDLTWEVEEEQAVIIESFLQARADDADWFDWTPPDSSFAQRFRCDEWTVEQSQPFTYRISASFRRAFEYAVPSLAALPTDCPSDLLCEPDFGTNNQADLWLSRITAPISNLDPQTYQTDSVRDHGIVMDEQGYSYLVWTHVPYYESPGYGWIVITKRDLGGNILWTKRTLMSINAYWFRSVALHDFKDGLGTSLAIIAQTVYGYGQFGSFRETWHARFSLSGDFRGAYAGDIPLGVGCSYLPVSGYMANLAIDPGTMRCIYKIENALTGAPVSYWALRQPGTIYASADIGTDGGIIEFTANKSLVVYNIGGNRLQITMLNDYIPESTALFINTSTGPTGGQNATVVKYENTALIFAGANIWQIDENRNFVRRIIFSNDWGSLYGARWSVKLDKLNDNIYLNSGASVYTLKYDLSRVKTLTVLSPGGNNYNNRHGATQGGGNMLSLNANRFVLSMDTLYGYGLSASGGRALLMVAGGRLSEIGSLVSMNAGGFTASAVGYNIDQPTTSTTSANTYIQSSMMLTNFGLPTSSLRYTTVTDATNIYQWGLYSTEY